MSRALVFVAAAFVLIAGGDLLGNSPQVQFIPWPALPTGTGAITGRVLNDAGKPAAGARVSLKLPECRLPDCSVQYSPTEAVADAEGRFAFANVGQVPVVVEAASSGSASTEYGAAAPGLPGTSLAMRPGEKIEVVIRLTRGASVSGTVFDSFGAPLPGAQVWAFRLGPDGGDGEMITESTPARTDETGRYQIAALPGGFYIIAGGRTRDDNSPPAVVQIAEGQFGVETGASYPNGEWINDAERLRVGGGETRSGIDLRLRIAPVTTISGVVRTQEGKPVADARVYLMTLDDPDVLGDEVETDAAGRFDFGRVHAGRYRIVAFDQSHPRMWGRALLVTDGRTAATDVAVAVEPAGQIAGRIVYDGRRPPPAPPVPLPTNWSNSVSLFVNGTIGLDGSYDLPGTGIQDSPWSATWEWAFPDTFSFPGIPSGRYNLALYGPSGWWLRSEMVDGVDALDHPFAIMGMETRFVTVTFTDRRTTIAGSVTNQVSQPNPDVTVVVFSTDSSTWTEGSRRVAAIRPDQHGEWEVVGLPEGDYWVGLAPSSLYRVPTPPQLAEARAGASRVTLKEGERAVANLRTR